MNQIYVGKLVNTHGLKGEVRIISDFEYKDEVFKVGSKVYINGDALKISSHRVHKNYDMVTFEGINNIDDVLGYKGSLVYINRDEYNIPLLTTDLIGMQVYFENEYKGEVIDILKTDLYSLLKIKHNKEYLLPNIKQFVKEIDKQSNAIQINYIKGLEDED